MAIHLSDLNIESFRGIDKLEVKSLNHINIIAGDNNCGKTSVLEAMLLLRNPESFSNVLQVANIRRQMVLRNSESLFNSFLNLFHLDKAAKGNISIVSSYNNKKVSLLLSGEVKRFLVDVNDYKNDNTNGLTMHIPSEVLGFEGFHSWQTDNSLITKKILFKEFDKIESISLKKENILNIVYLAPFDHLRGNSFSRIINDEDYKYLCIQILKLFDSNIEDILLTQGENDVYPTESIRHKSLGIMSLSTFGDGIKKVISIASKIAEAANGILMIDEIETAIHSKYYDKIFRFIISACNKFNVQLFITTHSIEAIDALLEIQDYSHNETDNLSVITLKKESDKPRTFSRVLSGARVFENREQFNFEVRL